jgi:uncharacterized membrane protein
LVANLAAAMMAVSPFGIFLAQEARHYSLGILWVIASVCCLVVALQHLQRDTPLPIWLILCWVGVNSLGMATHYFFGLTLCAEAIAFIGLWLLQHNCPSRNHNSQVKLALLPRFGYLTKLKSHLTSSLVPTLGTFSPCDYWRIFAVVAGTVVGCVVWLPVWQASHNEQMTQWIRSGASVGGNYSILQSILNLINPIFQALAAWITMVVLLPIESPSLLVVIASGAVMLVFLIYALPIIYRGFEAQWRQPEHRLGTGILVGVLLGAIALFFGITYLLGIDLTRGARYNFVYFPVVPVLLANAIACPWKSDRKLAVAIIWFVGLLSGITVISNLGYQKYYRPDLLVPTIQKASHVPILIATTHNTLVQTGEIMGIAWEFQRTTTTKKSPANPQFLLAHQNQNECQGTACRASLTLRQTLAQLPRPLDVWLVNFKAPVVPEAPQCFAEDPTQYQQSVNGYSSRLYHCLADNL